MDFCIIHYINHFASVRKKNKPKSWWLTATNMYFLLWAVALLRVAFHSTTQAEGAPLIQDMHSLDKGQNQQSWKNLQSLLKTSGWIWHIPYLCFTSCCSNMPHGWIQSHGQWCTYHRRGSSAPPVMGPYEEGSSKCVNTITYYITKILITYMKCSKWYWPQALYR